MEKISKEKVYSFFREKGYKIIAEYKNANQYVLCEKENGMRCFASYSNLKVGKSPIMWGQYNYSNLNHNLPILLKEKNSKTEFIEWKKIQKSNKTRCLVTFKCGCGCEFNKTLEDVVYKTQVICNECALKKRGKNRRKGGSNIIVKNYGYKILTGNSSYRNTDLFEVEDASGYRGFISVRNIRRGCSISKFDIRINKKWYVYNVNTWARLNGIDAVCVDFYSGSYVRTGLKFKCACGNEFTTSIASFQSGKYQCEKCARSISSFESVFKKYLEEKNINYIYQYSLNQCRDVLPLPFDFYLSDYNVLVEVDGQGHYQVCHFNQISKEKAEVAFTITQKHDKIKNNYCINNNIKLIRIPYWLFDTDNSYITFFQESLNE